MRKLLHLNVSTIHFWLDPEVWNVTVMDRGVKIFHIALSNVWTQPWPSRTQWYGTNICFKNVAVYKYYLYIEGDSNKHTKVTFCSYSETKTDHITNFSCFKFSSLIYTLTHRVLAQLRMWENDSGCSAHATSYYRTVFVF